MIFNEGDIAYFVEHCQSVRAVRIVKREGDMYLVKISPRSGFMIRHTKLYPTKEEAERQIIPLGKVEKAKKRGYCSPYDYEH